MVRPYTPEYPIETYVSEMRRAQDAALALGPSPSEADAHQFLIMPMYSYVDAPTEKNATVVIERPPISTSEPEENNSRITLTVDDETLTVNGLQTLTWRKRNVIESTGNRHSTHRMGTTQEIAFEAYTMLVSLADWLETKVNKK